MSDQPAQEKTEQPSPRRREQAREEGNVARSADLNSVIVLLAGMIALYVSGGMFFNNMANFSVATFTDLSTIPLTRESFPYLVYSVMKVIMISLLPILIVILLAGLGSNVMQIGILFSGKALQPKFDRVSPMKGFKRLFSMKSLMELVKGLLKMAIVGLIGYMVIMRHIDEYWVLAHASIDELMAFTVQVIFEMTLKIGIALLILAIADYAYQRWEYEKNLRMTKEELKEEAKQYEGSPEVKARQRSQQRQAARRRMMAAVPDATVVVTNPTHIAIAILYNPKNRHDAPKVVAKGKRKLAQRIKQIAYENGVPVIENKPLARSLYEMTEVGMEIPILLYEAIAEILAQVIHMNKRKNVLENINA